MESRQTSQPQSVDRNDRPPVAATWYGWQTFSTDGAAAVLLLRGVESNRNSTLLELSGLTFVVGAPVVHLAHGQWQMAILSLTMRGLAPLFGAVLGGAGRATSCASEACAAHDENSVLTGMAIGGLLVAAVDGLALAYDREWTQPLPPARTQALAAAAFPRLVFIPHGAALGISGPF